MKIWDSVYICKKKKGILKNERKEGRKKDRKKKRNIEIVRKKES